MTHHRPALSGTNLVRVQIEGLPYNDPDHAVEQLDRSALHPYFVYSFRVMLFDW